MIKVFISYRSIHRDLAEKVCDKLHEWGYQTWFDKNDIPEGGYFRHEIQKGLESSQVVIAIVTPEATQSREVMWEWDYGLYNSHFIPLRFADFKLPYHLQGTQYIDFVIDETKGFHQLRELLANVATSGSAMSIDGPIAAKSLISPVSTPPIKPKHVSQASDPQRNQLIQKVHDDWLAGVLDKALEESTFEIDLALKKDAVLRHADYGDYKLSTETNISQVFEDLHHQLLVLGAPGAGKTVLMLQLARQLLTEAEKDVLKPIPVVLNLFSWAENRLSLMKWVITRLQIEYKISPRKAKRWIENEQLVLLLDGLDEMSEDVRDTCVGAINTFRERFRITPIVVCSRIADYEKLTSKLNLSGAIMLQPLDREQIEAHLAKPDFTALRASMAAEPYLNEMANTPFLLNTMSYTYRNAKPTEIGQFADENERRNHLFDHFIKKHFETRPQEKYTLDQVRSWLGALAADMVIGEASTYYPPTPLSFVGLRNISSRFLYSISVILIFTLPFLYNALVNHSTAVILLGLVLVARVAIVIFQMTIDLTNRGHINFSGYFLPAIIILLHATPLALLLRLAVDSPILLVFYSTFLWLPITSSYIIVLLEQAGFWQVEPWLNVISTLCGIASFSLRMDSKNYISIDYSPQRLLFGMVVCGVIGGFLGGNVVASSLLGAVLWEGFVYITFGVGHILFWLTGCMPLRYILFLDFATDNLLLRRVGHGYTFAHRILRDYLAETNQPTDRFFIKRAIQKVQQEDDFESALADLNHAARINPNNVRIFITRGTVYNSLERYEEALADFEYATILLPSLSIEPDFLGERASAFEGLKRFEEALVDFNTYLQSGSQVKGALKHRAGIYYALEQYDKAIEDYSKVIQLGGDIEALTGRARIYKELKHYEQAIADYTTLIERNSDGSYDVLEERAKAYEEFKHYKEAVADYTRLIQKQPENINYLIPRIILYFRRLKNYNSALSDIVTVSQLMQKSGARAEWLNAITAIEVGCYMMLGQLDKALEIAQQISDSSAAQLVLGQIDLISARYAEALDHFSTVVRLNELEAAYFWRGLGYLATGEVKNAIADFQQDATTSLTSDNYISHIWLTISQHLRDSAQDITTARDGIKTGIATLDITPEDRHFGLAILAAWEGHIEEARQHFQQANLPPPPQYTYGSIYLHLLMSLYPQRDDLYELEQWLEAFRLGLPNSHSVSDDLVKE